MACGLRFFRYLTIIGGAGLESLSSITVRHPGFKGQVCQLIGKITMPGLSVDKFIEICAIMGSPRQFGYKRGNLPGLNSGKKIPKTIFYLGGKDARIIQVQGGEKP